MSKKIFIKCNEASFLINKKQETSLSIYERTQLYFHLRICDACRLFKKQTNFFIQLLKNRKTITDDQQIKLNPESKIKLNQSLLKEIKK